MQESRAIRIFIFHVSNDRRLFSVVERVQSDVYKNGWEVKRGEGKDGDACRPVS